MISLPKKAAVPIIVLELILLAGFLYNQLTNKTLPEPVTYSQQDTMIDRIGEADEPGFYLDGSFSGTERSISSPVTFLPRGVYNVLVHYDTDFFDDMDAMDCTSAVYSIDASSGMDKKASPGYILYRQNPGVSYRIHVDRDGYIMVKNHLADDSPFYLLIRSIEITQLSRLSALHYGLRFILFLIAINLCLLFVWNLHTGEAFRRFISGHAFTIVGLLVILFIINLPLFLEGATLFGHDINFHMYRIYGIAESIRVGSPLARVQHAWCDGYGYPVGVFYGQTLLYPSALLYLAGFSLDAAYKFCCFLINAIGALGSYAVFRRIGGNQYYGLAGSLIFSMSIYRLSNVYLRAAIGESAAISFMPLILWGLWGIYDRHDDSAKSWIPLSFGASLIIQSHVLSTVIIAAFCLVFVLLCWRDTLDRPVLFTLGKALVATLLLSAYQLVPFVDYMLNTQIRESSAVGIRDFSRSAIAPIQLFANAYSSNAFNASDGIYKEMPLTLGFFSLFLLAAGLFLFLQEKEEGMKTLKRYYSATVLFILAASTVFPWSLIRRLAPVIYDLFNHMQFSWRFLCVPVALIALLFILVVKRMAERYRRDAVCGIAVLLCFCACFEAMFFLTSYADNELPRDMVSLRDSYAQANGEYLPADSNIYQMRDIKDPEAEHPDLTTVSVTSRYGTTLSSQVDSHTAEASYIDYPVLYYKGYHAEGEHGPLAVSSGDLGRIRVSIPSGYTGGIQILFREPVYWRVSEVISFLTAVGLLYCILRGYRNGR